jgi:hypothetical protein
MPISPQSASGQSVSWKPGHKDAENRWSALRVPLQRKIPLLTILKNVYNVVHSKARSVTIFRKNIQGYNYDMMLKMKEAYPWSHPLWLKGGKR